MAPHFEIPILQAILACVLVLSLFRLEELVARPARRPRPAPFRPGFDASRRPFTDPDGRPWGARENRGRRFL